MSMTENKRYSEQNLENHLNRIFDNHECKVIFDEEIVDLLNEQDAEIERLKEFKNKVFKEINTELSYLTEKAMDNPVNYGRIKALKELKRCVK